MTLLAPTVPAQTSPAECVVSHPTACPSWCKDRDQPKRHNYSQRDTAHRSSELMLADPNGEVLVRAELFQLDEMSTTSGPVIYVQGQGEFELAGPDADIFISQAQAFLDALRVRRAQMG
ncbi:DUF6907 domain-containing protein [Streptomyces sp. NPDC059649]|uniref:DUF6907 domain-containing protein n=1 Tax=Streptomyces sp. NPDC059649 TaxID=3346895 RepID=UPI00369BAAAB